MDAANEFRTELYETLAEQGELPQRKPKINIDKMAVDPKTATTPTTLQQNDRNTRIARPVAVVGDYNNITTSRKNPLDADNHYQPVDLLQHLSDNAFIKRFSRQTAEQCQLPESTVFMNLLGIFSSVACRRWAVQYETGGMLPIGLYVVTEQPPGTGKSRCQGIAQKPFFNIKSALQSALKKQLKTLSDIKDKTPYDETKLQTITEQKACVFSRAFISNATPEAIEKELIATSGYFSAVSSEQGLFNSLLGLSYNQNGANNNDIILYGFDGGYVSSCRVTREGYHGNVIGGCVLFAQSGSVEKVLSASNGTGLAERFLMLCEPHNLGSRDHFKKVYVNEELSDEFSNRCMFAEAIYTTPIQRNDLLNLHPTEQGYNLIKKYRQSIEPSLADGGEYSHLALRGAGSKIDMQILKIAANLHLLSREDDSNPVIPDGIIQSSIHIANTLLESSLAICRAKGLIGDRAEYDAILRMFESDMNPKTERQIIQSRSRVEPFKNITGNKSVAIRQALSTMTDKGVLTRTIVEAKTLYQLNE
jgi:hypothetical protein